MNSQKIFLNQCQVIEISSWQVEQAVTMFNSVNSIGLPLSNADKISAQLYSKAENKKSFVEAKKFIVRIKQTKIANIDSTLYQFIYINRAK
ncbi:MAG: hypothetical protein ACUVQ1_01695 [Candidatus Kapaibacteriales bacterium]